MVTWKHNNETDAPHARVRTAARGPSCRIPSSSYSSSRVGGREAGVSLARVGGVAASLAGGACGKVPFGISFFSAIVVGLV